MTTGFISKDMVSLLIKITLGQVLEEAESLTRRRQDRREAKDNL